MKAEAEYFSPHEVISGLNVLMAIIDWPQDTLQHQKNFMVSPEAAKTLILPLHPLWDEKVEEVASQMRSWDKIKISNITADCLKRCDCEFYQAVFDRHPEVLETSGVELKNLVGLREQKNKADLLNCLKDIPSIQKLLSYLEKEKKNYEAESVL